MHNVGYRGPGVSIRTKKVESGRCRDEYSPFVDILPGDFELAGRFS
jgi:hypothetical protein